MGFNLQPPWVLILLLLVGTAVLGAEINAYPINGVDAGKTYTITYSPGGNTPTTFILRKGFSTGLATVGTLTTSATGGTFQWTVSSSLVSGSDYALEIRQGSDTPNFSGLFSVRGSSAVPSSVAPPPASAPSPTPTPVPQPSASLRSVASSIASPVPSSSRVAQSADSSSTPASSLSSGSATSRSSGISTPIVPAGEASSSATIVPPGGGGGGLSTGAKAGIGVGASTAGLSIALGAFYLGMSVHKKSKKVDDAETSTGGGKPELDGKVLYKHEITPELDAGAQVPVAQERHTTSAHLNSNAAKELQADSTPVIVPTQSELHGTPQHFELSPGVAQGPRHELDGNATYNQSPVAPIVNSPRDGLNRADTYNDPRLVQNPWAQDETLPRR
ncbi:hypothetical protein FB567DRAFT_335789 [Paraphoma chrysanthemicola]|uniref:Yeast cell wall synthesis Kre9/Knh1-like N-terminal domain-containing protein n=1 Tax=Paraphoma chrysanthemicola TaxID=798071 RepID=A0A8K0VZ51_9PLEO|nr:hypothetical protein FB567DRAFT_335789 [Paraphoma chrysanthemicola]